MGPVLREGVLEFQKDRDQAQCQVAESVLSALLSSYRFPCTVGFAVLDWPVRQVFWLLPVGLWVRSRREGPGAPAHSRDAAWAQLSMPSRGSARAGVPYPRLGCSSRFLGLGVRGREKPVCQVQMDLPCRRAETEAAPWAQGQGGKARGTPGTLTAYSSSFVSQRLHLPIWKSGLSKRERQRPGSQDASWASPLRASPSVLIFGTSLSNSVDQVSEKGRSGFKSCPALSLTHG